MPKTIKADGKAFVVPDDATDEEINQIVGPAPEEKKASSEKFDPWHGPRPDEGIGSAIFKTPVHGIEDAIKGAGQVIHPGTIQEGLHNMFSGGMRAAAPFVLPEAAIAAPLATLAGAGLGMAGSTVGREGARMIGAPPETADLAGDVGGVAGAGFGSQVPSLARGVTGVSVPKLGSGAMDLISLASPRAGHAIKLAGRIFGGEPGASPVAPPPVTFRAPSQGPRPISAPPVSFRTNAQSDTAVAPPDVTFRAPASEATPRIVPPPPLGSMRPRADTPAVDTTSGEALNPLPGGEFSAPNHPPFAPNAPFSPSRVARQMTPSEPTQVPASKLQDPKVQKAAEALRKALEQ